MNDLNIGWIEEQIMLLLDNELNETDAAFIWEQIENNPKYKDLYNEFAAAKLSIPEIEVVDFSYLKKTNTIPFTQEKKKMVWPFAAAVLVAIGGLGTLMFYNNNSGINELRGNELTTISPLQKSIDSPKNIKIIDEVQKDIPQKMIAKTVHKNEKVYLTKIAQPNTDFVQERALVAVLSDEINNLSSNTIQEIESQEPILKAVSYQAKIETKSQNIDVAYEKTKSNKGIIPGLIEAGQWIVGANASASKPSIEFGKSRNKLINVKF